MSGGEGAAEATATVTAEPVVELEEAKIESEEEELLARAQKLISKINAAQENPNPKHFHALASMLEKQEARFLQDSASSSYSGGRASHSIGRLANILNENDEFVVSLSTKFLSENRYPVSIRAAAARLLLSGSSTWMVFDDSVIENAKNWLLEDTLKTSDEESSWKDDSGRGKPTDSEMLKTYATGILAISLTTGGEIVEDMLNCGLSEKLMRYLRIRVLGDPSIGQKDVTLPSQGKHTSGTSAIKGREDGRGRLRHVSDSIRLDAPRTGDEGCLGEIGGEVEHERSTVNNQNFEDDHWENRNLCLEPELADASAEAVGTHAGQTGEQWHIRGVKSKCVERQPRGDDTDENGREDLSRRRANRGLSRTRGNEKISEGPLDGEKIITSPAAALWISSSGTCHSSQTEEAKGSVDAKNTANNDDNGFSTNMEDNEERFICIVGLRDISDFVRKAVQAAEAEARVANAPAEAIKAAGDAAAELVKTNALEVWKNTNDSEAAALAASEAASTVIDAASASEVLRSNILNKDSAPAVKQEDDDYEDLDIFILDCESLSQHREKYCIQCLEILGEYVEALGPVLHEKGVDVCLALLQRSLKQKDVLINVALLPEVLKLICALAAHRKFAAIFVDRGGIQKLLAVQRNSQTYFGLSSCLFTIGSLQGIMERVCALPSGVVHQVVELALQLFECSQDMARKNAATFFASAFVFRAILDCCDAQEGLQKMLNLLQTAASVRSGANSVSLSTSNTAQNERPPSEVLTASEKQIAYHTCVAMRQYFRAHLLLLVDSLRPSKSTRSAARSNNRAAYKPLDISNEAMDNVFIQIQRDRKLGPAFVRARWPAVDQFLSFNGHTTVLELCQAPPSERYLHDLAQYALGILHIITLVPYSRKLIVNAALSNDRVGMAVILDAANGAGYVDPEVIHPALEVLINLVCPPPSISIKPSVSAQCHQSGSAIPFAGPSSESRERNLDRSISDRAISSAHRNESRDRDGEVNLVERSNVTALGATLPASNSQTCGRPNSSGVVGDRRISLGPGAGCAGLAAQLEQGYRQAREAVRANNGIKVLLYLLHPRMVTPPGSLDRIRALACRVLLGLARDDTIAHILTKLQVGKKLSELIRDSGTQSSGTEQGRWQTELAQVAIELIAIVTNAGRASTLMATDAAAPTLRRIERAAIAAATPITYDSRELLLLVHEHLMASGLAATAALLEKEASLTPLPCLAAPQTLHQASNQEVPSMPFQWPSGRASSGFLTDTKENTTRELDPGPKTDLISVGLKKKQFSSSSSMTRGKIETSSCSFSTTKPSIVLKSPSASSSGRGICSQPMSKPSTDSDQHCKTPILLPMKRKLMDCKDSIAQAKRSALGEHFPSPVPRTPKTPGSTTGLSAPSLVVRDNNRASVLDNLEEAPYCNTPVSVMTPGLSHDPQHGNQERLTLDSLVVQSLKYQHRQCPAPITTLPPLSLLHPHVCPEPSRSLDAPANATARLSTRELRQHYGGIHAHRRDRQFVYSRFRPWRTYRDDASLLSCLTFLGDTSRIATGIHSGELKIFDSNSGDVLDTNSSHQSAVMFIQSAFAGEMQMILSSGSHDVKLWDASSISGGPLHSFDGCKAACFSHSGNMFAALSSETSHREILLYDIQRYDVVQKFRDSAMVAGPTRGHVQSRLHFSPSDTMLMWNGVLWDRRCSNPVHHFDQFSDYGGGGFHPAGNEVIINSEVWDLRKLKLLRSVPSLDQTVINFNAGGDVIYAILRRNVEDITSATNSRRFRHPLFAAFRTIDATSYSDVATIPVDRCVLDLAADPTDSFVGVVAMDDHENLFSSARLYEIGRRRATDDDSDADDVVDSDEEEDEDDSEADVDALLGPDLDGDSEGDDIDSADDLDSGDELDDDADFNLDDVDFDAHGVLEMGSEGEDDDSLLASMSDDDGDLMDNGFGF